MRQASHQNDQKTQFFMSNYVRYMLNYYISPPIVLQSDDRQLGTSTTLYLFRVHTLISRYFPSCPSCPIVQHQDGAQLLADAQLWLDEIEDMISNQKAPAADFKVRVYRDVFKDCFGFDDVAEIA